MNAEKARIATWLRASRPENETQEWLAADIERVTGWHITRDRYSKYESGSLPIGPKVLGHFVDYWQSRGVEGPDAMASPDTATPSPGEAALPALLERLDRQAEAISDLIEELRLARSEQAEEARAFRAALLELAARPRSTRAGDPASGPRVDAPPAGRP